jgi:hypothetical protein
MRYSIVYIPHTKYHEVFNTVHNTYQIP